MYKTKAVGANNKDHVASVVLSLYSNICHLNLMTHMFLMLRVRINGGCVLFTLAVNVST